MDQENLFHAKEQTVHQHDFSEGLAGANRFHPPLNAARRRGCVQRFIERLDHRAQRFRNRLANRGTHDGEERVRQDVGIRRTDSRSVA